MVRVLESFLFSWARIFSSLGTRKELVMNLRFLSDLKITFKLSVIILALVPDGG